MEQRTLTVQKALNARGFKGANGKSLVEDGIDGPNTSHAIIAFKKSVGLLARDYVGPITYAKLVQGVKDAPKSKTKAETGVGWYDEMLSILGRHEKRDNSDLRDWLKSDGSTVGDPARIPWCGDAVETAIKRAIPGIETPKNPYLAANWNDWGENCDPFVGAIVVFWRSSPSSWKGHIGFIAGENESNWYVLGGNQGDSVTITPISKSRVRKNGIRCPKGYTGPRPKVPSMYGGTVSTNEA